MSAALDWNREGRSWPDRDASQIVIAGGIAWRTIVSGTGPTIALLHGTGASAHSWRGLVPLLAASCRVIAPDLPGHGFTRGKPAEGLTLRGMSTALADLLRELDSEPELIVGHSAGVAIALQFALDRDKAIPIVGFNPAIAPFRGFAAPLFSTLARLLLVNPVAPALFARIASLPGETARFLKRSTGSNLDPLGVQCYRTLFGNSGHCRGALSMMAAWDLEPLHRSLPDCRSRVLLVHSAGDRAVPYSSVKQAGSRLPDCRIELLPELGHLAHEERPGLAAAKVLQEMGLDEGARQQGAG